MDLRVFPRLSLAMFLAWGACPAASADQAGIQLEWTEGPEYPMGIQDSALGVVSGMLVSAGGFTRHPKDVVRRFPDAFGGARDGFTALTFLFDPAHPTAGWTRIADLPGPPRQAALAVVVGEALYVIGGFNYTEPYTYRSVYRLARTGGQWRWTDLSADLPWPVCPGRSAKGPRSPSAGEFMW
jgi:hypothetical protein